MHLYQTRPAVSGNVLLPRCDLSFPKKSIAFIDAVLWNEFPVSIKKVESLDSDKNKHETYYVKIQKQPNDKLPFSWSL